MERLGADRNKTGCSSDGGSSDFLSGPGSPSAPPPSSRTSGRRTSSVSDSGDTGFYTYSSDSVEDVSSYSQRGSTLHPQSLFVPGLSPVRLGPLPLTRSYDQLSAQQHNTAQWYKSCQQLTSALLSGSTMKTSNQQPIRKSSSLNKLSSWAVFDSTRTYNHNYTPDTLQGSLDRGLLKSYKRDANKTDFSLPLSSSYRCNSSLLRSPGSGPCHHYKLSRKSSSIESDLSGLRSTSAFSSPIKHNFCTGYTAQERRGEDWNISGRGLNEQPPFDSPLQPEVRTQMWLSEQMAYRPKFEPGASAAVKLETTENYGEKVTRQRAALNKSGIKQMMKESPVSVPGLVKFQEGLLRQREQEINWQKQQIVQLQARITENELRVQQVQHSHRGRLDDHYIYTSKDRALGLPVKQDSPSGKDLNQKLGAAEMELLHLKNVFKQVTQKHTEDISKMEEKIQTRDRYICSLKKKCSRESEQKQEKHERVETLESYLSDLPTLTEVHNQSQQLKEVQQKTKEMERHASRLQKTLQQGQLLLREKSYQIEQQTSREHELLASVHSLQQKVQCCLEDGVRVPYLKQLEGEKAQQQQDHSSKQQTDEETPQSCSERPEVDQLLRDMSVCVRDLQALGSVLVQRAQGQEPNLSVLLGIKSLSVSAEESERPLEEEELRMKMMKVSQLRRDIEDLRSSVSQPQT